MSQDERIKELEAKLTERIRPNVEAAPWVIYEISNLEDQLSEALATNDLLKSTNVSSCRQLSEAQAEIERLRGALEFTLGCTRNLLGNPEETGLTAGMSPMFYHTLSYEGDMELRDKYFKAKQALAEGKDDG